MLIEGLIVFALRAVLGVFLAYCGALLGYLLGYLGVFSTPEGVGEGGGLQTAWLMAVSAGAGAGALAAWWGRHSGLPAAIGAAVTVVALACLAGWMGHELAPVPERSYTPEPVVRTAWGSFAAVSVANIAAMTFFYRKAVQRRIATVFRSDALAL